MTESEKIKKVVNEGHVIAKKVRSIDNLEEFEALVSGRINAYGNFVDDNFGVYEPDDLFNENMQNDKLIECPREKCAEAVESSSVLDELTKTIIVNNLRG